MTIGKALTLLFLRVQNVDSDICLFYVGKELNK